MRPQIQTYIDIKATAPVIWDILTDLDAYQHWNPFIIRASGRAIVHETLVCEPRLPRGRQYVFRPVVTRVEPHRLFVWTGYVLHPWLGAGEHIFRLETLCENQTRLIHDEHFTGVLSPLVVRLVGRQTTEGFILMNEALKRQAEAAQQATQ